MGLLTPSEELRIYRGKDYPVNEHITIHIPTLGEISDYGEDEYYGLIHMFTATPTDLSHQLYDMGIDFTAISEYQLFSQILSRSFSQEQTQLLFGDIDFSKMKLKKKRIDSDEIIMESADGDWFMDEFTYSFIADCLRDIHKLKKNVEIPANQSTKIALIEDARDKAAIAKRKEHHSYLLNLISAMINVEGFKYNHDQVWGMKINAFMDSVMRVEKIRSAAVMLQSGYSGFGIDLKKIDKKQLDWTGDL